MTTVVILNLFLAVVVLAVVASKRNSLVLVIDWRTFAGLGAFLLVVAAVGFYPNLYDQNDALRRDANRLAYELDCRSRKANAVTQTQGPFLVQVGRGLIAVADKREADLDEAAASLSSQLTDFEDSLKARDTSETDCAEEAQERYP